MGQRWIKMNCGLFTHPAIVVVMQIHPAEKNYINSHPHCLHLWRPTRCEIATPPLELV